MGYARMAKKKRRRCIVHDRTCGFAGGPGVVSDTLIEMMAVMDGRRKTDAEIAEWRAREDATCRQVTPWDKTHGLGIYADRPSRDEAARKLRETADAIIREEEKARSLGVESTVLGAALGKAVIFDALDAKAAGVDVNGVFEEATRTHEAVPR